jgi:hypothetical protein
MATDKENAMTEILQLTGQLLPAIMLNLESKLWNELVLAFLRAGDVVSVAVSKADQVLSEHRERFGSEKTKDLLLDGAPKADIRAIR